MTGLAKILWAGSTEAASVLHLGWLSFTPWSSGSVTLPRSPRLCCVEQSHLLSTSLGTTWLLPSPAAGTAESRRGGRPHLQEVPVVPLLATDLWHPVGRVPSWPTKCCWGLRAFRSGLRFPALQWVPLDDAGSLPRRGSPLQGFGGPVEYLHTERGGEKSSKNHTHTPPPVQLCWQRSAFVGFVNVIGGSSTVRLAEEFPLWHMLHPHQGAVPAYLAAELSQCKQTLSDWGSCCCCGCH